MRVEGQRETDEEGREGMAEGGVERVVRRGRERRREVLKER